MVGNPAKADVTGKHAQQVEHDEQRSCPHNAETTPALCDRKRQIRRNPGEQSPPRKQSEEVEQEQDDGALAIRCAENDEERIALRGIAVDLLVWRGHPCPRTASIISTLGFQTGNVAFCRMLVEPHLRFRHTILYPERNESGKNSDKKHHPPVGVTQNDACCQRRQRIADGPRTLHHGKRLSPQFIGPGFCDQGRAGIPLASHAQSKDETKHCQHKHGGRKPGSERADRVSQDAEHQSALASDAIGEEAEKHAADSGGQQGQRVEQAGGRLRHAEIAHHVGQDKCVKHRVERVQHPAESGRQQGAALLGVGLPQELNWPNRHAGSDCSRGARRVVGSHGSHWINGVMDWPS